MSRFVILKFASICTLLAVVASSVFAQTPPPKDTADQIDATQLQQLATVTGRDVASLELNDRSTITLINGLQLVRVKAFDRTRGDIVGAAFDGDQAVDEQALRIRVTAEWRAAHGALTFDLVNKLAQLAPTDTLDVGIWLKADFTPMPKSVTKSQAGDVSSASASGSAHVNSTSQVVVDGKPAAAPIPADQVPADARASLQLPANRRAQSQDAQQTDKSTTARHATAPAPSASRIAAIDALRQQNTAYLRMQIVPIQARFAQIASQRGLTAQYASETAPIVFYNDVTRQQIEELAFLPEVDTIYDASQAGGPLMGIARPTQNADLLENIGGYTGSGTKVAVVEGGRIFTLNPYLTVAGWRDASRPSADHSTAVGGMIASTHPTVRGLAPGVTLYTANGDDYQTAAALATAMDYGSTNASVLNNSFWVDDEGGTDVPQLFDRHMDYIVRYNYDFSAVAAGNFGAAGCQYSGSLARDYVSTPGKGYNALTVGNYDDHDTLGWSGDSMSDCSSYNRYGRYKPEVAAVGTSISSTLKSSPWIGPVGSGTSYASPMVAALAADLIQIDPGLVDDPEVIRSIIMATALHNIEGNARLSDQDGVGGIDASVAAIAAENGWFDDRPIDNATGYPLTFSVFAWKGEHVRFVINWLSNPASDYSSDPQPLDLDLTAYRQDGTTIAVSASTVNNYEIVDFVSPADQQYQFKITKYSGSLSGGTWLGTAWSRGPYRIHPDTGYYDGDLPPMGMSLAVLPSDWSYSNYWHAIGIRSASGVDYDLELNSASYVDDPGTRHFLAGSYASAPVDFVLVDNNHYSSTLPLQYAIMKYTGMGGVAQNWSSLGIAVYYPGWYGPFTMGSNQVVKSFDIWFSPSQARRIYVVPADADIDYEMRLYRSDPASSTTWVRDHSANIESADGYGIGGVESLVYLNNTTASDWLGLAVASKTSAAGSFYLYVENTGAYVPIVWR